MSDQHTVLEKPIEAMVHALREIADSDCYGYDDNVHDAKEPCSCPPCVARRGLAEAKDWRYVTHWKAQQRLGYNPRERKIIDAWKKQLEPYPDRTLAQILWEETARVPSVRDWYVATSVVQWMATNIGMSLLEAAGYKYTQYDEDSAEDESRRVAKEHPNPVLRLKRVFANQKTEKGHAAEHVLYSVTNTRHQVVTTGTKKQLEAFARELLASLEALE